MNNVSNNSCQNPNATGDEGVINNNPFQPMRRKSILTEEEGQKLKKEIKDEFEITETEMEEAICNHIWGCGQYFGHQAFYALPNNIIHCERCGEEFQWLEDSELTREKVTELTESVVNIIQNIKVRWINPPEEYARHLYQTIFHLSDSHEFPCKYISMFFPVDLDSLPKDLLPLVCSNVPRTPTLAPEAADDMAERNKQEKEKELIRLTCDHRWATGQNIGACAYEPCDNEKKDSKGHRMMKCKQCGEEFPWLEDSELTYEKVKELSESVIDIIQNIKLAQENPKKFTWPQLPEELISLYKIIPYISRLPEATERAKKSRLEMNETIKTLETRRSCRKFKSDMITEEELQAVLKAGTFAPTGRGMQSPIIIAVTNKEIRDKLSEENRKVVPEWKEGFDPFYNAPVILIVLADKSAGTYLYDGSLVIGNLMNAASSLGLGSCWIHRAKEVMNTDFGKKLLADLGIEGDYEGIGNVALGYADGELPEPAKRKDNYVYYVK